MASFLWHNYHSTDRHDKFTLDLRYTSYVDISELATGVSEEQTQLFRQLETLRQRNIREARRAGAQVEAGLDPADLLRFYAALMAGQGSPATAGKLERMDRLIRALVGARRAVVFGVRDPAGLIQYMTVFCFDRKRAYYLFGAGNPESDSRYTGTLAFWDAFRYLATRHDVTCVDLEGVNSPRRGWFKLSFGGDLRSYYQVYKRSPHSA